MDKQWAGHSGEQALTKYSTHVPPSVHLPSGARNCGVARGRLMNTRLPKERRHPKPPPQPFVFGSYMPTPPPPNLASLPFGFLMAQTTARNSEHCSTSGFLRSSRSWLWEQFKGFRLEV